VISHNDRPDWGHGPNPPVRMWTAEQIRAVMEEHRDTTNGCLCSWRVGPVDRDQEFTADHLIDELEKL
jgi:hypothetical protein